MSTRHALPLILALTVTVASAAGRSPAAPAVEPAAPAVAAIEARMPESVSAGPLVEVRSVRPSDTAVVVWAANRFRRAGLELPALQIHFHTDKQACRGYDGFHDTASGVSRIDVCTIWKNSWKRVVLHEMAHAWVRNNLDDEDRAAFVALRGAESWNDGATEWKLRGTEHAAEVIAWGLDDDFRLPGLITNHQTDALLQAFDFLVGGHPLVAIPDGPAPTPTDASSPAERCADPLTDTGLSEGITACAMPSATDNPHLLP